MLLFGQGSVCVFLNQQCFPVLISLFFSITRLRLEVEAETEGRSAQKVLRLRWDSNFMLTTVLWGNVGVNVLLTLLSNSVLAGVSAFFFSTFVITFLGEIMPQAYFTRHALKMASLLLPLFKTYQMILYPVAKPTSKLLDWWIGKEGIQYFREQNLRELIRKHIEAGEADIDRLEGLGAMNFLAIDDMLVSREGESVDPQSVINLPLSKGFPVFPAFERIPSDPFLKKIQLSGKKWIIITDEEKEEPRLVLDSDGFLRAALFDSDHFQPYAYCHRPIIVKDISIPLGNVISKLRVRPETTEDDDLPHIIVPHAVSYFSAAIG